jgi:RNA polymerase sigma factor (sigma-70 family)
VPDDRAADDAHDFAQQACEIVYREPFPYDVSFDAWTTLILHNCIRQRDSRSRDLIDRDRRVISLDLPDPRVEWNDFSLYDVLSDVSGLTPFERLEVQEWLLQAIGRLRSRVQQQVIINTYFDELSDEDIAQRLGKSKNNVQLLRHRALKRLKQILEKK